MRRPLKPSARTCATGRILSPRKTLELARTDSIATSALFVVSPTTILQTFAPRRANRRAAASGTTPVVSRPSVTNTAPASSSDGIRSSTSSSADEKSVVRPPNSYGSTSYLEPSIDSTCAAQFVATERRVGRAPSSAPASPGAPSVRCIESERSTTTATRRWRLRVTS